MAILQKVKQGLDTIDRFLQKPFGKNTRAAAIFRGGVQGATAPLLSTGSVATKVAGGTKDIIKGTGNYIARKFSNPLAGVGVKTGVRNVGTRLLGGALGGLIAGGSLIVSRSVGKNEPVSSIPSTLGKAGALGLAFAGNPITALLGYGVGTAERAGGAVKGLVSNNPYLNSKTFFDQMDGMYGKVSPPVFSGGISTQPVNLGFSVPQMQMPPVPSFTAPSSSFSPSVSVGGGGFDPLLLLLLAGGAGALGYQVGKRKKKKYKKRRKRK